MMNRIEDVVRNHLCTGCGACAAAAPKAFTMTDVASTGRRPLVIRQVTRHEQAQALAVCPGATATRAELPETADPTMAREWGPILESWEAYAADPSVRHNSSSGGAVTALGVFALEAKNFAGVAHIKANPEKPIFNIATISRNPSDVIAASGSRYAPASPCESLTEIAQGEGQYAFIGKPCDVEATSRMAKRDPQLAQKIGLTISIFCAGVPSLNGTKALLKRLGVEDPETVQSLRYRGAGWPGTMAAVLKSGEETPGISYSEGWGDILQKHRQWRCHVCADHTGEHADLSIGDPWDRPSNDLNEAGRSLIIVRSERGRQFLKDAIAAGVIVAERRTNDAVALAQPNLSRTRRILFGRLAGLRLLGLAAPAHPGFALGRLWLKHISLRDKAASVIGTMQRARAKRLRLGETTSP